MFTPAHSLRWMCLSVDRPTLQAHPWHFDRHGGALCFTRLVPARCSMLR
jgi:hypothetical protein